MTGCRLIRRFIGRCTPRLIGRVGRDDMGSAIVEFSYLALLLLVPLAYGILTLFELQKAAYAVTSASREAGRAFVTSAGTTDGYGNAYAAAGVAAADHRLRLGPDAVHVACSPDPSCLLAPGQRVEVNVRLQIRLPLVPRVLDGVFPATVAVSGRHVESVDRYRETAGRAAAAAAVDVAALVAVAAP